MGSISTAVSRPEGDEILTVHELCERLRVSRDVLDEEIRDPRHPIPCLYIGKRRRFVWSKVCEHLAQRHQDRAVKAKPAKRRGTVVRK